VAGRQASDHDIAAYDFDLPAELIAQEPLAERDASRLLALDRASGRVSHHLFRDLPQLLRPGDLLVTNRSRVAGDVWLALVRPGRRLKPGVTVAIAPDFSARIEGDEPSRDEPLGPLRRVRLLAGDGSADLAIERHGHVPLPPYIRRPDAPADLERYQTVYAREAGSVAAPTAGLHFTPALLDALAANGVETASLVLHVGPGTFRPVEADDVREHRVAPELFSVPVETAAAFARARADGRRVVAVGTTVTRVLETALDPGGRLLAGEGETSLVVVPGVRFRAVDALVTNFHLPRSSLLLLVSAFAGRERVLAAYGVAVAARYRFYSYGDAMLVA
jgi:S-adenosylmethionine:tRNA ribosyltransferase-isomerase